MEVEQREVVVVLLVDQEEEVEEERVVVALVEVEAEQIPRRCWKLNCRSFKHRAGCLQRF